MHSTPTMPHLFAEDEISTRSEGVVVTDLDGTVLHIDQVAQSMFHGSGKNLLGKPFGYPLMKGQNTDIPVFSSDGSRTLARMYVESTHWNGSNAYLVSLKIQEDILSLRLRNSLQKSNSRFNTLLNASPLAIVIVNGEGKVIFWSANAEKLFGWESHEVLGNVPPIDDASGEAKFSHICSMAMQGGIPVVDELEGQLRRDDSTVDLEVWVDTVKEELSLSGSVMAVMADVTEKKRIQAQLNHLSTHDGLTGLPNRTILYERINHVLSRNSLSRCGSICLLRIGVDNVKTLNASFGLHAGDHLLLELSKRLMMLFPQADIIARNDGHVFSMLFCGLDHEQDAVKIARKTIENLKNPFYFENLEVVAAVSIGIAICLEDGMEAKTLLRNADVAMYRARGRGSNLVQFFSEALNSHASERFSLVSDLRHAVERNELRLFYQPVTRYVDRKVCGVEALLRWQHPVRGLVRPDEFIALAEEEGLIIALGDWALREGCKQVKFWQRNGHPQLKLAVNLSARQFADEDLLGALENVLDETGFVPGDLNLELTESTLASDCDTAIDTLHEIKRLGIEISIDDFGTGYSSLSYLTRFPIDVLKIDQSFVQNIHQDNNSFQVCSAIANLARGLNLRIVAEGVETQEQLDIIGELQCDEIQGYFFSRPLPAHDAGNYLRNG